jgi:hypothetical protein
MNGVLAALLKISECCAANSRHESMCETSGYCTDLAFFLTVASNCAGSAE